MNFNENPDEDNKSKYEAEARHDANIVFCFMLSMVAFARFGLEWYGTKALLTIIVSYLLFNYVFAPIAKFFADKFKD